MIRKEEVNRARRIKSEILREQKYKEIADRVKVIDIREIWTWVK